MRKRYALEAKKFKEELERKGAEIKAKEAEEQKVYEANTGKIESYEGGKGDPLLDQEY